MNGFRMHYEDHGRGEPVVFLHGFTLDGQMWAWQRGLAKKYRVIVPTCAFMAGQTLHRAPPSRSPKRPDDVRGLLDHLKISRAHLVGMSMGGGYALGTAVRYPERILTLTLASPSIQGIKTPPEATAAFMKGVEASPKEGADVEALFRVMGKEEAGARRPSSIILVT